MKAAKQLMLMELHDCFTIFHSVTMVAVAAILNITKI